MLTPFEVYLITLLDGMGITIGLMAFFLAVAGLIVLLGNYDYLRYRDDMQKGMKRLCDVGRNMVIVAIALLIMQTFIPSTKQMCAILVVPHIVNNEDAKAIPQEMLQLFRKQMGEWYHDEPVRKEKSL